ncbi:MULTISPECIES: rhomboid family intramembrane serine protease [Myxococcus]|uniref:Rhomboid family intramembrane serine protease n=1 Tax=Myxococcus xanthus TaxID=34 RepID=A0AAE6FVS8_MYXXA|nr:MULTISPECIES: rhomboid family intramembrane serine protease [Myxococcus]QDE66107.1 rhomboid family intramembrane serine protease [Myxococcus xanthus]QDE73379.1 rhomboid family intramembrane serine protease [Myxococcus xanthus]QDE80652.1 rhomboid family intramembrane serine protease [Myxococcus xanthus]QDE94966.1 rhomboid family intramembrane serine protease [Myxococcus xanthus]QDF02231.1 rhomboid family intramembrane serine protease [Myxococcus xanthus]
MIPISDDNPTLRTPVVTYLLLGTIGFVWVFIQGAGLDAYRLAASVCNLGMVPGELTGKAALGLPVPLGDGLACVVDNEPINLLTPITSMFLHGGWGHLLGNCLFFWVFGNNVEDSMGRLRFVVFYLLCGLAAAAAHLLVDPSSPVPTVGASGAISGVMGAYLLLYPRVRVNMLFIIVIFIRVFSVPAWAVLLWWFCVQLFSGLPQLNTVSADASGGVAFWAHIGGFVAGMALIKLFQNPRYTNQRTSMRHRLHPNHP